MTAPLHFRLPPNFSARCSATNDRVVAGEPMTQQQLADALGLPFEFVGAAVAIGEALITGRPVLVDPSPVPFPN